MHLAPTAPSLLPEILGRATALNVIAPDDETPIRAGCVYVAPPDWHLAIEPGLARLTRDARENRHRPAIDVLFRTAARAYKNRVVGIVLTGLMSDGAAGVRVIKHEGGIVMVQDPQDAAFSMMPESALDTGAVDLVLPAAAIPEKILELATDVWEDVSPAPAGPVAQLAHNHLLTLDETLPEDQDERLRGRPSPFTCPDCSGTLWELNDGDIVRFRCRVGHSFTGDGMHSGYAESVESALWSAVRSLEEGADLEDKLADIADRRRDTLSAGRFRAIAHDRRRQASVIRAMLLSVGTKTDQVDTA